MKKKTETLELEVPSKLPCSVFKSSNSPHVPLCDLDQVRRLIALALGPSFTCFCEDEPHTPNWKVIVRKDQRPRNETLKQWEKKSAENALK